MLEIHSHTKAKINPNILAQVVTQGWCSHSIVIRIGFAFHITVAFGIARRKIQEIKTHPLRSLSLGRRQSMTVGIATGGGTLLRRVRVVKLRVGLWGAWILVLGIVIHRRIALSIRPGRLVCCEVGGYRFLRRVGWPCGSIFRSGMVG